MLKDLFLFGNIFNAVEHSMDEKGNEVFYLLQILKKKNELFVQSQKSFSSHKELLKKLKEKSLKHIVLVINNQNVLSKKNELSLNEERSISLAFPTISVSEFYYQIKKSRNLNYISLARK